MLMPLDVSHISELHSALSFFTSAPPHTPFLVSFPFWRNIFTSIRTVCVRTGTCLCAAVVVSQPISRCQGAGGLQMVVIPI